MAKIPKLISKEIKDKYQEVNNSFRDIKGRFIKGNIPFDRTGIPHTEETKKKLKEKRAGRKPNLGHHHTESFKEKQRERLKEQWKNGKRKPHYGHITSVEQKRLLSEMRRGNKNPGWIDGRSKLAHQIRRCFEYRQWRSDIFTRDNFTCQECEFRGGYLAAHHIKEFYKIIEEYKIKTLEEALNCEELWNINNGITLCKECHEKTKKYVNNKHK
jgi:5-methylcytosine-specific restriction endonuclease McrA